MIFRLLIILYYTSTIIPVQAQDVRENFKFSKFKYDNNELSEALKFINNALNQDSLYVNAYFLRSQINYKLGKYYNSVLDINRIFKLDENSPITGVEYFIQRGASFLELDDYDNAELDFKKAIEISSENYRSYFFMAKIDLHKKRFDSALENLDVAARIEPFDAGIYSLRAEVKSQYLRPQQGNSDYRDILSDLNMALNLDTANYLYFSQRSDFLKKMGETEKAMHDYNRMIALSPKKNDAYTSRGVLKMHKYEFIAAAKDFSKSISLNPDAEHNYRYRGLCYNNMNNFDKAYKDFTKSIDLLTAELQDSPEKNLVRSTLAETYVLRGHCLNLMGSDQLACRDFARAYNLGIKKGLNYYRKFCGIY